MKALCQWCKGDIIIDDKRIERAEEGKNPGDRLSTCEDCPGCGLSTEVHLIVKKPTGGSAS